VIASAFGSVHDFFHSSTWYVIRNLAILLVIVIWVATIYWVYKDARRRIGDSLLVWVSTALGVLPFIGPLIYMLFRPPEYLEDVRERELEIRAMEERLGVRDVRCPVCRAHIEEEFLICPVCTTRLRQACTACGKPLEAAWQVCPYCETPIVAEAGAEAIPLETKNPPARRTRSRAPRAPS
jgi:RNA polymerase subunit RPABC4/transcription elongation factor Spt4